MLVNEKLAVTRATLEPELRRMVEDQGLATRMALAAVLPDLERRLDAYLALPAEELDGAIARAIDVLCRHRSDCAGAIVATPAGAFYGEFVEDAGGLVPGHPVRGPHLRDGSDPDGQEHLGPGAVPVGGGPAAGDRPGG